MSFNFTDYLIYSQNAGASKESVAVIAQGVLAYVNNVYSITLETNDSYAFKQTVPAGTTFTLDVFPVSSIDAITTSSGTSLGFDYLNYEVTLDSTLLSETDVMIECRILANTSHNDLKVAIYRHIDAVLYATTNHTDSIAKVVNSSGSTTYFLNESVPQACKEVYEYYSPRQVVLY